MNVSSIPLIGRARGFRDRTAVIASEGAFTYHELLDASSRAASCLLDGSGDLAEARVAFLTPPGSHYVATQWGIWRAGGIAVPLAVTHPVPELEYVVDDSGAATVVAHREFQSKLRPLAKSRGLRLLATDELLSSPPADLPEVETQRRAMVLYTSGTTGRPKGVVTTHANIQAQVTTLVSAWGWTPDDHILDVLPLHHVHGIINAMTCALWTGATCEILPRFEVETVWKRLSSGDLTLFMGVPTTYERLIEGWEQAGPRQQRAMSDGCSRLRLMVSGSDALAVSTFEKWKAISGHALLERYGMTEIGMALSNPLSGTRVPGYVGSPLPGVQVRLVELEPEAGAAPASGGTPVPPGQAGELQVKGPSVFKEYWGKPEVTTESFTGDGWFRTGDVASVENGIYRIWGRASQDILKTGGEKVSANEVQRELSMHPDIVECAVVGLKDETWGQAVSAAIVVRDGSTLTRRSLRQWAKRRLAGYKAPQRVLRVDALPRNAMGKVIKPQVVKLFEEDERHGDL